MKEVTTTAALSLQGALWADQVHVVTHKHQRRLTEGV